MKQNEFYKRLEHYRIIASVKNFKSMDKALGSQIGAAVLSIGNIGVIKQYVDLFKMRGIPVFIHMERIGGISCDREGITFLAQYVKPDGIVTTKNSLIKIAKKLDLLAIQRVFLIDSESIGSGILSVQEAGPDAVELMPALLPEFIQVYKKEVGCPIIAGGLIASRDQMNSAVENGAIAVSIGNRNLWA